jgi:hypothetical protein
MADARQEARNAQVFAEPLLTVLEHIEKQGSLLSLVPDRVQRLGLMKALTQQKLVSWNAAAVKYELTSLGHPTAWLGCPKIQAQRSSTSRARRSAGRLRIKREVEQLIVRMAEERHRCCDRPQFHPRNNRICAAPEIGRLRRSSNRPQ